MIRAVGLDWTATTFLPKALRAGTAVFVVTTLLCAGCGGANDLEVEIVVVGPRDLLEQSSIESPQAGPFGRTLFEGGKRFSRSVKTRLPRDKSWRHPFDISATTGAGDVSTTQVEVWLCAENDDRWAAGWDARETHEVRLRPSGALQPEAEFGWQLAHVCEMTGSGQGEGIWTLFRKPQFCSEPDRDTSTTRIDLPATGEQATLELCQARYSNNQDGRFQIQFIGTLGEQAVTLVLGHCVRSGEQYPIALSTDDLSQRDCPEDVAQLLLGQPGSETVFEMQSGSWTIESFDSATGGAIVSSYDITFGAEATFRLTGRSALPHAKVTLTDTNLPLDE